MIIGPQLNQYNRGMETLNVLTVFCEYTGKPLTCIEHT